MNHHRRTTVLIVAVIAAVGSLIASPADAADRGGAPGDANSSWAGTYSTSGTAQKCQISTQQCGPLTTSTAGTFQLTGPCDGIGDCRVKINPGGWIWTADKCMTLRPQGGGYKTSLPGYPTNFELTFAGPGSAGLEVVSPVQADQVQLDHLQAARTSIPAGSETTDCSPPGTLPGAPSGVKAASGKRSATVSWVAPASVGSSPISGYRVFVVTDGVVVQTIDVGNVTSTVVGSLTPGRQYEFRVAAISAVGVGPSSGLSNTVTPLRVFTSSLAAAQRQFQDLTGKPPSSSESSSWAGQLDSGAKSLGDLAAALRSGVDNTSNVDPTTRLYGAYLLRTPDAGGLKYWIGRKRSGTSLNAISQSFATSSEFKARYGSLSNRQFVERIYQNVLGRPGEPSGVTYWTGQLDAKKKTRGQVMVGFSEAAEYKRTQGPRVEVAVLSILLLGRAPTAAELQAGIDALAGGASVADLADAIYESDEYADHIGATS